MPEIEVVERVVIGERREDDRKKEAWKPMYRMKITLEFEDNDPKMLEKRVGVVFGKLEETVKKWDSEIRASSEQTVVQPK